MQIASIIGEVTKGLIVQFQIQVGMVVYDSIVAFGYLCFLSVPASLEGWLLGSSLFEAIYFVYKSTSFGRSNTVFPYDSTLVYIECLLSAINLRFDICM